MITLKIQVQQQLGEYTCWAAVASSISQFYDPNSIFTQCFILSSFLNKDCCGDFTNCDQSGETLDALTLTKNFRSAQDGIVSMDAIMNEITNNNPIVLRVDSNVNINRHVIVVYGFDDDNSVWVQDPWNGYNPQKIEFDNLELFYENEGRITKTYLVQPNIGNIFLKLIWKLKMFIKK